MKVRGANTLALMALAVVVALAGLRATALIDNCTKGCAVQIPQTPTSVNDNALVITVAPQLGAPSHRRESAPGSKPSSSPAAGRTPNSFCVNRTARTWGVYGLEHNLTQREHARSGVSFRWVAWPCSSFMKVSK